MLACYVAILLMQLILALALGSQRTAFQVLQAIFPALAELTVKHQSYRTLLARNSAHPWLPYSILSAMGMTSSCSDTLEAGHSLQPTLSTLERLRFPVSEPLSFPIYHILVTIFHPTQAALLLYVDSHRNSDPKSLERSRGTLPLMETRGYK